MVSEAFGDPGNVFPTFALPWLDAFRSGSKYCLLLVIAPLYAVLCSTGDWRSLSQVITHRVNNGIKCDNNLKILTQFSHLSTDYVTK